jgi:hypothetical protein
VITQRRLERMRAKRVAAAEKKAGLRDGSTYKISGTRKFVRVFIRFHPSEFWAVEDLSSDLPMSPIKGSYRRLDDKLKAKLEKWL